MHSFCRSSIIISILFLFSSCWSQFEVNTIYTDGIPNNNCYFSNGATQLGLTNRNGIIYINDSLKGSEIHVEDLQTGSHYKFILNQDTTLVTEQIQKLEEVKVKPRDRKKLLNAVIDVNQERLFEKLNIKGSVYIAELYILNSGVNADTVLKIFTCDMIITDINGNMKMHVKNPIKLEKGEADDQELLDMASSVMRPEKNFKKTTLSKLNYSGFRMKKHRKFKSRLITNKHRRGLIYSTNDSTNLLVNVFGKVNKYSWRKKDSTLLFMSKYYFQESSGSNAFNVPFSNSEYSNPDGQFSNGYLSTEQLMEFSKIQNNVFYYFAMEKIIEDESELSDYKTIDSFEKMYSNTRSKKMKEVPDPKIYPLKFPFPIFF